MTECSTFTSVSMSNLMVSNILFTTQSIFPVKIKYVTVNISCHFFICNFKRQAYLQNTYFIEKQRLLNHIPVKQVHIRNLDSLPTASNFKRTEHLYGCKLMLN